MTIAAGLIAVAPAGSTWSGQNGAVAYSSRQNGNRDIFSLTFGGVAKRLTTDPAPDRFPSWSPDGRKLAFTSTRGKKQRVWLMNADGRAQRALTSVTGDVTSPSWSADGRSIFYNRLTERGTSYLSEIRNIKINGTGDRRVLAGSILGEDVFWPRALADGTVAFLRRAPDYSFRVSDLCLINPDGSNFRVVTSGEFADFDARGDQLVTFDLDQKLRIRGVDGAVRQTLDGAISGSGVYHVVFSPDGSSLLYPSGGGLENAILTVVPVDGSARTTVSAATDRIAPDFSWQPLGVPPGPPLPKKPRS